MVEYEKMIKKYKRKVKADMKALGVYQKEFDTIIDIYAGMLAQYDILTQRLIDNNLDIEVETQRGGTRKSATATAQEKLRNDIIMYTDRLMLNPKALLNARLEVGEEPSKLAEVLASLEERWFNGRAKKEKAKE